MLNKVIVLAALVCGGTMGCSAAVDSSEAAGSEDVGETAQAITIATSSTPVNVAVTPGSYSPLWRCSWTTVDQRAAGQATASRLLAFALGNDAAFPSTFSPASKAALLKLRASLADGSSFLLQRYTGQICQRDVVRDYIVLDSQDLYWATVGVVVADTACDLACIGYFVSDGDNNQFYQNPQPRNLVYGKHQIVVSFDPEPAQVRASLSGSAGASAAAVYVNSETPVNVVKWSAGYALGGANPPTAGAPCSTVDLAVGAQATQAIFKNGSYYKCF